jgi:hypothetical protein
VKVGEVDGECLQKKLMVDGKYGRFLNTSSQCSEYENAARDWSTGRGALGNDVTIS